MIFHRFLNIFLDTWNQGRKHIEIYINSYLMSAENCYVCYVAYIVKNKVNGIKIWEIWKGQ